MVIESHIREPCLSKHKKYTLLGERYILQGESGTKSMRDVEEKHKKNILQGESGTKSEEYRRETQEVYTPRRKWDKVDEGQKRNTRSIYSKEKVGQKESSLKLKMQKHLLNLSKEVPTYDEKIHVCRNHEIFESFVEKFDLSIEQKNQLFKIWLPLKFSRRLESEHLLDDESSEWSHDSDVDRLKKLLWCTTSDSMPTYEILHELKIGRKECTFSFMSMFERTCKAIGICNPRSIVREFIKKFTFLNAAALVFASDQSSLLDATKFLDNIRKDQRESIERTEADGYRKRNWDKVYEEHRRETQEVYTPRRKVYTPRRKWDKVYEERRNLHVARKPYNMITESAPPSNSLLPVVSKEVIQCELSNCKDNVIREEKVPDVLERSSDIAKALVNKAKNIQEKEVPTCDVSSAMETKFDKMQDAAAWFTLLHANPDNRISSKDY
ncbi:hypothetical protein GDO81_001291 [Engystomops pustulosus]|uniref:Retrotransposon gag domain-containing protein n=1 Tax=Engystomops pustulosus TaxID=76066 RepID=A0AAV7DF27_ENGPU|nr:hypothetical protein GDO81_001291 [Engystomops pustulosus]